jgi:hypothetical protein
MDDLERQLRDALAREKAPEWFEARVMNAVNQGSRGRSRRPRLQWMLATAMAGVIAVGAAWEHHRTVEEREAGEAAKAKLQIALRITSTKLQEIQRRIEAERND